MTVIEMKPLPPGEPCPECGQWWQKIGSPSTDAPPSFIPATPDKGWIQTASGGRFYINHDVKLSTVTLEDIAAALSKLCRYTGHSRVFYSVAEHSYYVSLVVPEEHAFHALLHDASEAYLGDVSTPLKGRLDEYREIEVAVSRSIYARFDLPEEYDPCVKAADYQALAAEVPLLFDRVDPGWEGWLTGHKPIPGLTRDSIGWTPEVAERLFLDRARYLWERHASRHRAGVSDNRAATRELLSTVNGIPLVQFQTIAGS